MPINDVCSNFVKFGRREIGKIVVAYLTKKFVWLSSSRYCAPKICQGQPRECIQSASDFIQIGSLSAELYSNA